MTSAVDISNVKAIDFETTNVDPSIAEPVEVALYDGASLIQSFIRPEKPIPVETSAIHHITDPDVRMSRNWADVRAWLRSVVLDVSYYGFHVDERPAILVAHNAKYEQTILGDTFKADNVHWICTYKCALRVWPDAPNHKNETLRYWLNLPDLGRAYDQNAHSAGHDAKVTFEIFLELLLKASIPDMVQWSKEPAMLPRIPFGKHRGMKWSDVPYDYLSWITKQADMEPDVKFCASNEITRRRTNATVRSG